MTINHILPSEIRANELKRSNGTGENRAKEKPEGTSPGARSDRVEISQEGRILSAKANEATEEAQGLSQDVLEEIQRRIEDGTYDSPEMAEEVARQILNSGDLEFDTQDL